MSSEQSPPPAVDRIGVAAHMLAIRFSEDADLPARYRQLKQPSRKFRNSKEDSEIEKRFKLNAESWMQLIHAMLARIDESQAWRFINSSPQFDGGTNKVVEHKDFCDFLDYLILRRDVEHCGSEELGGLALLSIAFQREVEKHIQA
jgi:hypothetical protein